MLHTDKLSDINHEDIHSGLYNKKIKNKRLEVKLISILNDSNEIYTYMRNDYLIARPVVSKRQLQ
jgi:hypothetical protein